MPVFILEGDGGEIEEDDVVAAYGYIHDMRRRYDASGGTEGAFVVVTNSSFGVDYGQPVDFPIWCAMYDSLGALGILNAGATINFNDNVDSIGDIPTTCSSPYIIAVTNTTRNDELNPNAGFGAENIDLGAPGTQVYSTVPGNSGGYGSGTSMATPHVAGAIALLYAAACPQFMEDYRNDPAAMALLVRQYLLDGVTPIADLALRSVSGGRLNIYNSMVSLLDGYCSPSGLAQPQLPDASLHLYPNPLSAGGILYVEGLALLPATATANPQVWSLRDALGRPFRSGQWRSGEVLTLSLEGMTPGMYFFESAGSASPVLLLP